MKMIGGLPRFTVNSKLCGSCHTCEVSCPERLIEVETVFEGNVEIITEKCDPDCSNCIDICPMECLLRDEEGKITWIEKGCSYCGACVHVCPPQIISVKRVAVREFPEDYKTPVLEEAERKLLVGEDRSPSETA